MTSPSSPVPGLRSVLIGCSLTVLALLAALLSVRQENAGLQHALRDQQLREERHADAAIAALHALTAERARPAASLPKRRSPVASTEEGGIDPSRAAVGRDATLGEPTGEQGEEDDDEEEAAALALKPLRPQAGAPTLPAGGGDDCDVTLPSGLPPRQFTSPPQEIPADMLSEFTLGNTVPVYYGAWSNDQNAEGSSTVAKVIHYGLAEVTNYVEEARLGHSQYYGDVDVRLFTLLARHPGLLEGKDVVVLGSLVPWYEAVAIAYKASTVTTIEYGPRTTDHPQLHILTPAQFASAPRTFDIALCISSYEHDGLGRYGDPLSGIGDLRAMAEAAAMLRPGGHLLVAVPRGADGIVFNHHRIYGPRRWELFTRGWREIDQEGFTPEIAALDGTREAQPVYLLAPTAKFCNYERGASVTNEEWSATARTNT